MTTLLREKLHATDVEGEPVPHGRTVAEALVEALCAKALDPESNYDREIFRLLAPPSRPRADRSTEFNLAQFIAQASARATKRRGQRIPKPE